MTEDACANLKPILYLNNPLQFLVLYNYFAALEIKSEPSRSEIINIKHVILIIQDKDAPKGIPAIANES